MSITEHARAKHSGPPPAPHRAMRIAMVSFLGGMLPSTTLAQELGWSGVIEASANVLFGAARGRVVALKAGAERGDSTLEFRGDLLVSYADTRTEEEDRQVTARATRMSIGIDHRPFERVSPFWFGSVETSLQQRIDRRYITGAGAKLTVYQQETDELSASLALLWERTRALDPEPPAPRTDSRSRWSLRLRLHRQLAEAARLEHVTFYQPDVERFARYTAESTTSLALILNSRIALTATLRDRYDSEARSRGAPSNHDGQLLFGARASW